MKKIFLCLLIVLCVSGSVLANLGELNAKFSWDFSSKSNIYKNGSGYTGKGYSVSVEYLANFPILNFLKLGVGSEYLLPRKIDKDYAEIFSFCSIYVTAQINPFIGGLFIKGNFGQNAYCNVDEKVLKNISGGQYYAVGIGYKFYFYFIVEFTHSEYNASGEAGSLHQSERKHVDMSYAKNSLNFGYKFKI